MPDDERRSRRRFLKVGLIGTVVGSSGCLRFVGGGTNQTETPSGTRTAASTPTPTASPTRTPDPAGRDGFTDWLPTPQAIGLEEMYRVTGVSFPAIRANKQHISDTRYSWLKSAFTGIVKPTGVGFDNLTWIGGFENIWVAATAASEDSVSTSLTDAGFSTDQSVGEFTIYVGPDGQRRIGVNGQMLVLNRRQQNDSWAGTVEQAINTNRGNSPRLAANNADAQRLLDAVGSEWTVLSIGLGPSGDSIAIGGATVVIDGKSSTVTTANVYTEQSAIEKSSLKEQASQYETKSGVMKASYTIDGRVAVIELTAKTQTYVSSLLKTLIS